MNLGKKNILWLLLLCSISGFSQANEFEKRIDGKTILMAGFYHLGGYSSERPTFYLEQQIDFHFHQRFSAGFGLGINLYPSLLAFPIYVHGKYHFKIKPLDCYLHQSFGKNVQIGQISFNSNRYLGSLGFKLKLKTHLSLDPELGYSLIWDRYGGGDLTLLVGLGIKYTLHQGRK